MAIDVTYAAVGLVDIYIRQGLYKDRAGLPQPPYVPGLEVAGTIRAISQGLVDIRTQVFPLAEAAEAHRRAENGSAGGRILLAP